MAAGTTLTAEGGLAEFVAEGPTTINGANLYALSGGVLRLDQATSYNQASSASFQTRTLRAQGAGSVLSLQGVTTITNGTHYDAQLAIEALDGGSVDLRAVASIADPTGGDTRQRAVFVTASGYGSTVRLDALTSFTDTYGLNAGSSDAEWSTLTARDDAEIVAPLLATLRGVHVTIDAADGGGWDALTSLTSGRFTVSNRASVTLSGLTAIDGSSFFATGGGSLTLPVATSYSQAAPQTFVTQTFRAEGIDSLLDLGGLTALTNGTFYASRLTIEAVGGGTIDLHSVATIDDATSGDTRRRSIDITADGTGSTIRLNALTSITDAQATGAGDVDGRWSTLTVRDATIEAPNLNTLTGVSLSISGLAVLPLAQITSITSGQIAVSDLDRAFPSLTETTGTQLTMDGAHVDFPGVTSLRFGGVTLTGGGTVALPNLVDIDGASFFVSDGVTLSLPGVVAYNHRSTDNFQVRTWRAEGPGSRIELPALATITNGTHYATGLDINARDGGTIDLALRHRDHRPGQRRHPTTLHQPQRRRRRQHDPPRRPDHD